ncbi:MAG: DUF881 domain-containing protein [Armatimonadetes bacterium]|nr:DUF881 domain-containing protein [Armatimonadota bacterium]
MSTIMPTVRGKSWVFQVTGLCIVLGALLGLSLKTQRQVAQEGGVPNRMPALRVALAEQKQLNEKLKKDVVYYRTRCEDLSKAMAEGTTSSKSLERTLNDAKMLAGTIAVRGPGVVLSITDSPQLSKSVTDPEVIEQYVVHDTDLRAIVNELFAAGAEAVCVNGHRIAATSSIRCAGSTILVNSDRATPPYVIKAIGKPDELESALRMPGGVLELTGLIQLDMVTIKREPDVLIPAYAGSTHFSIAKPVLERRKNR